MIRGQDGFTLPETLVAGTLSLLMVLPLGPMLVRTHHVIDLLESRFKLNEQARAVFSMLASGTANHAAWGTATNARGFNLIEALRSRASAPLGSSLRSSGQFQFSDGSLSVTGDALPGVSVQCVAAANPIPDCTSTEVRTMNGWIGSDPVITTTGQQADVQMTMTDPLRAARGGLPVSSLSETYRMMFTLRVEANP